MRIFHDWRGLPEDARGTVVALEADDHRAIGAAVFVRGFLRRYAALVGEPAAEIEALYAKRPDAELRPDLSKTGMHRIAPAAQGSRLGLVPAVIAAVVLSIAGAVWWAMRAKPQPYTVVSEEHTQTLPAARAAVVAAAPATLAFSKHWPLRSTPWRGRAATKATSC